MTEGNSIKRILLVDDDRDYRNLLRTYIGKYLPAAELHEYDPVSRGAPAEDFDWGRYDVLILDYYLCIFGLTGLDLLQKHRKKPGFPATIMLTGAGNEEVAVRALNFGVYEYLRKEKLTREQLITSIHNAFQRHQEELTRELEQQRANQAFDKPLFYKLLEHPVEALSGHGSRVLLLIDIDHLDNLADEYGLIMRDNLLRHLARQSYETFKQADNPYITRLGDASTGVLIDYPGARELLEKRLQELWVYMDANPYQFADKAIHCTVSIGALIIDQEENSVVSLVDLAGHLQDVASLTSGNSFHISSLTEIAEAENKRRHEQEQRQKAEEEAERERLRLQEELKRRQEQEQSRQEAAARQKAEAERKRQEEEQRRAGEVAEKRRIQLEEEQQRREAEARKAAEAEKLRAAEQEKLRREEEKRQAEDLEKQQQETEAGEKETQQVPGDVIVIDESALDENSLILKKAFNENRVIQTFQPVIAMYTPEAGNAPSMFKVDIVMIDEHGNIRAPIDIDRQNTALNLQQFTDRWILREIIGRIVNSEEFRKDRIYLVTISDAWLADVTLFNWLKKLLTGMENIRPGNSIALEFPVTMLVKHKKRAQALMKALKQSHGFEIAVGEAETADELKSLAGLKDFDLLTVKWKLVDELRKNTTANSDITIITALKNRGTHLIFDGIEDSTMLTEAISVGADYVMGSFIGEPQNGLAATGNVETFDISY
jgi:DNA-binding response OmpR family regulator/EAL domain-containing protein (putative c-di-GMP-specific phosphodiesterase class I)